MGSYSMIWRRTEGLRDLALPIIETEISPRFCTPSHCQQGRETWCQQGAETACKQRPETDCKQGLETTHTNYVDWRYHQALLASKDEGTFDFRFQRLSVVHGRAIARVH